MTSKDTIVDRKADTDTYHATYHYPSDPPSTAIALAIATMQEQDPTGLDPLYERANVNPDALDTLFEPSTRDVGHEYHVTFEYYGYTITVKRHGRIVISEELSHHHH